MMRTITCLISYKRKKDILIMILKETKDERKMFKDMGMNK